LSDNATTPDSHPLEVLKQLGLTQYQAKVYLSLIRNSESSTKQIARSTSLNRGNVHNALVELSQLGLVEKIISVPIKYKAVPIDDAVSLLIAEKACEFTGIQTKAEKLVHQIKTNSNQVESNDEESALILVPAKRLLSLGEKAFNEAMHSIEVIASRKKFHSWITRYSKPNLEALERGVKMRVILNEPEPGYMMPDPMNLLTSVPNFNLKYTPIMPKTHFSIYDGKIVFCNTSTSSELTDSPSCLLRNSCIVSAFKELFELRWSTTSKQTS
jgi:sugar-specific transcriptional regulator TrmB